MKTINRIKQISDNENIKITVLEKKIGASKGVLSRALKNNTDIQSKWITSLVENYPHYNPTWLLTGKGDMLKNAKKEELKTFNLRTDYGFENQQIPLYNLEASAGLVELFQNHGDTKPIDTLSIPNLPKCDGALFVTGDSMYPLLKSGDIIVYKQIHDIKNGLFWGEMYLVSVSVDDEEYISVKYIQKSEKGEEYIKLVSQNQHHQPKTVPLKSIRAMALIKASVRINSMG